MNRLAVVFVLGCGSGCGSAPASPAAPAAPVAGVGSAAAPAPSGWERDFNKALESWSYEKYTPGADGNAEPNRFYVGRLPDDAPADMDGYAAKLVTDNFQDLGYRYSEIAVRKTLGDGWLLVGTVTPLEVSDEDRPEPGFVMLRRIGTATILCKAGTMKSAALRDEAIEMCKLFKP